MIILNHFIIIKHINTLRATKCFLNQNTFLGVVNMVTKLKLQSPPHIRVILGLTQNESYNEKCLGKKRKMYNNDFKVNITLFYPSLIV